MVIDWQQVNVALMLITAIMTVNLFLFSWLLRRTEMALPLMLFAAMIWLWALMNVIETIGEHSETPLIVSYVEHLITVTIVPVWLGLVLVYSGKRARLRHPALMLSGVIPAMALLVIWVSDAHALPWIPHLHNGLDDWRASPPEQWLLLWVHTIYFYSLLYTSSALLLREGWRVWQLRKQQAIIVMLAAAVPWVGIGLYFSQPSAGIDFTPFVFSMAGALLAWTVLQRQYVPGNISTLRWKIIREMDNGIIMLDRANRIVDVNPAAAHCVQMDMGAMLGRTLDEVFQNCPTLWQLYRQHTVSFATPTGTEAVVGEGAAKRYFTMTITPISDDSDNPSGTLLVLHDVTDLKHAQVEVSRRLREITTLRDMDTHISSSLDINNVLDAALSAAMRSSGAEAGFITLAEGASQAIVWAAGKFDTEEFVGRKIPHAMGIVGRVVQCMEAEMVCDVRGDSNYFPALPDTCAQMTIPLITHDSVVGVLNLETSEVNCFSDESFEFVKLLAGRIAGSVENAQLYTLSLKQVVELKGTYDQVRELEQIKTQMFRIATHDLKDPLNVITGYLSLMEMDEAQLSTDHVTFLEEMRKQSNRMLQIIDDILTMERMKEALVHEPINMQEIVNDAINDMVSQAIQKTQVVETKLPDGLTMVNGDRVQIREAVTNLIGNAIKYTPDGGHITIKLENAAERIVFEVKDDGYGIPEDRQRRLFQPFYRAKAEGTENIPGTGLGLHLVKDIIERHGGGVRFNSVFGKGSTFGFDLPSGA